MLILAAAPAALAQAPSAGAEDGGYRLGAGDKVRVTTFGEPTLSGEFLIDGSGMLAFPLLGSVSAGGHTAIEVQEKLTTALQNGYLKDPKVSVEVLGYRPFYILGEVTQPGTYPYTEGLTVLNAVATAQGFTYRANTRKVFIKRQGEPTEREVPLTAATMVAPGDTIRISERFF